MYQLFFSFLIILFTSGDCLSQKITSVHTKWDDSFREWTLFGEESQEEGSITMRWVINNDWAKWDYSFGDEGGSIDLKWRDNPEEWEIRGYDDVIYARTVFPRDLSSWRLKNDDITLTFESKYSSRNDEWRINTNHYGQFVVHTEFRGDPRDWMVFDDLSDDVSFSMKVAMIFLALHHGSPHE